MQTIKQIIITAVVAALVSGLGVPYAKQALINGHKIKRGTITGKQVKFPRARPLSPRGKTARARVAATGEYQPAAVLGSYTKSDPASVLEVAWNGSASGSSSGCLFQLRVDGREGSGGAAFVFGTQGLYTAGQFSGLAAGEHEVEVFAKLVNYAGGDYPCTVGGLGIPQTANATEIVH